MRAPTLATACVALDEPTPEAKALRAVQACAGRLGAAALSPSGALASALTKPALRLTGGPAALDLKGSE